MKERITTFKPDNLEINENLPIICIVGAGFSGLLTAIRIKEDKIPVDVVVIDKPQRETNTQISGMRIRSKRASSDAKSSEERSLEVTALLAKQNNGVETASMKEFSQVLTKELSIWNKQLVAYDPDLFREIPDWFGPQWGKLNPSGRGGRGLSILSWLKHLAFEKGVKFLSSEVTRLERNANEITALELQHSDSTFMFRPNMVILANGNAAGRLFISTNRSIKHSATELLFNAGLPIEGSTLIMWHPFGFCNATGNTQLGCYETDTLNNTTIMFNDGTYDEETTQLLREHQAHYHFKEIAKRFIEKGSIVRLMDKDGNEQFARVALHYSHLGARTTDGTRVEGVSNLAVTGDAGGLLYWTNYQTRLPGFALAHCIVSAKKAAEWVDSTDLNTVETDIKKRNRIEKRSTQSPPKPPIVNTSLKEINTRNVLQLEFSDLRSKWDQLWLWSNELSRQEHELNALSHAVIDSWACSIQGDNEPIVIKNDMRSEIFFNK